MKNIVKRLIIFPLALFVYSFVLLSGLIIWLAVGDGELLEKLSRHILSEFLKK